MQIREDRRGRREPIFGVRVDGGGARGHGLPQAAVRRPGEKRQGEEKDFQCFHVLKDS